MLRLGRRDGKGSCTLKYCTSRLSQMRHGDLQHRLYLTESHAIRPAIASSIPFHSFFLYGWELSNMLCSWPFRGGWESLTACYGRMVAFPAVPVRGQGLSAKLRHFGCFRGGSLGFIKALCGRSWESEYHREPRPFPALLEGGCDVHCPLSSRPHTKMDKRTGAIGKHKT